MKTTEALKVRHAFENIRNNYVGWGDNPNFKVLESALSALSASTNSAEQQPNNELVCRDAIALVCEGWTLPADARKILEKALWSSAPQASDSSQPVEEVREELESMTRMFHAACADLGQINEALGLDPNDGGAEPILYAIEELKAKSSQPVSALTVQEIDSIQTDAFMKLSATGYTGGMGGLTWDRASARAIEAAVRERLSATSQPSEKASVDAKASGIAAKMPDGSTAANVYEAFERGKEFAIKASQPSAWNEAIEGALDKALEVVFQARESIGAGGYGEQAQHERGIVGPYLDHIEDELRALRQQAPAVQEGSECRKRILLKAAYDLLFIQDSSIEPLYLLSETARYDGDDQTGFCLLGDIEKELGIDHPAPAQTGEKTK